MLDVDSYFGPTFVIKFEHGILEDGFLVLNRIIIMQVQVPFVKAVWFCNFRRCFFSPNCFRYLYRNASWLSLRDEFTICYCQLSLLHGILTKRCKQIIKYQLSRRIRTSHHLSQQPKITTHNFPPGQIPGNISPVPCNFMTSDARSRCWPPCQDSL